MTSYSGVRLTPDIERIIYRVKVTTPVTLWLLMSRYVPAKAGKAKPTKSSRYRKNSLPGSFPHDLAEYFAKRYLYLPRPRWPTKQIRNPMMPSSALEIYSRALATTQYGSKVSMAKTRRLWNALPEDTRMVYHQKYQDRELDCHLAKQRQMKYNVARALYYGFYGIVRLKPNDDVTAHPMDESSSADDISDESLSGGE